MTIKKSAIYKSVLAGILIAIGLFSAVVFLDNSWIKTVVIGSIIVSGIVWLVSHGLLRRTFKYAVCSDDFYDNFQPLKAICVECRLSTDL